MFNKWQQEKNEAIDLEKYVSELHHHSQEIDEKLQQLTPQYKSQQCTVDNVTLEYKRLNHLINENVLPLDEEIKQAKRESDTRNTEHQAITSEIKDIQTKINEVEIGNHAILIELKRIENFCNKYKNYQNLSTYLPLWRDKLQSRKNLSEKIFLIEKEINHVRSELSKNNKIKEDNTKEEQYINKLNKYKLEERMHLNTLNTLLNGDSKEKIKSSYQECLDQQEMLSTSRYVYERTQEYVSAYNTQNVLLQKNSNDKEKSDIAIENLLNDYRQQEKFISEIKKILALEHEIVNLQHYRESLNTGDACPLCGSTDHPSVETYQAVTATENEMRLAEEMEKLKILVDKGNEARIRQETLQVEHNTIEKTLHDINQNISQQVIFWKTPAQVFGWVVELIDENLPGTITVNHDIAMLIQQAKSNKEAIDARKQTLDQLEQQCLQANQTVISCERELQNIRNAAQGLLVDILNNENQLHNLSDQHKSLTQELIGLETKINQQLQAVYQEDNIIFDASACDITIRTIPLPNVSEQQFWLADREKESEKYQNNFKMLDTIHKQYLQQNSQLQRLQEQLIDKNSMLDKAQKKSDILYKSIQILTIKRCDIFGNKEITQERQRVQDILNQAEAQLQHIVSLYTDLQKEEHTAKRQIVTHTQRLVTQKNTVEIAYQAWQEALSESVFTNENEFISMMLTDADQDTLMQLKQSLDNELLESSALQKKSDTQCQLATINETHHRTILSEHLDEDIIETITTGQLTHNINQNQIDIATANKQLGEIEQVIK